MNVSSFISARLSFKGKAAVTAIAVSFLVMSIATAIAGGFRNEIRRGLASLMGDIRITPVGLQEPAYFIPDGEMLDELSAVEGVDSVKSVIFSTGIVRNDDKIHGVVFKGVHTADSGSLNIAIPSRLASLLSLKPGDRMLTYFVGANVSLRKFTVETIYDAIDTGDDRIVVFCDIHTLRRVNRWEGAAVSSLEVILKDNYRSERKSLKANSRISHILYTRSDDTTLISTRSCSVYRQIFDWLNLIDFNVLFILAMMTVVAGINMTGGLLILLFENIRTIGLLKSVGMADKEIAKTFLKCSSRLIIIGMALGDIVGLGFCVLQSHTHLLGLNPENYFISYVPVHIDWTATAISNVLAFTVIMLILLIPCVFISRVDPASSIREK